MIAALVTSPIWTEEVGGGRPRREQLSMKGEVVRILRHTGDARDGLGGVDEVQGVEVVDLRGHAHWWRSN